MAELPNDEVLYRQHSLSVEHLLKEEFGSESPLNVSSDFMGVQNIWSNCPSSTDNFHLYNGCSGSTQWPFPNKPFANGSPVKEAPLSSPESDAGSDHSWRCDSGVNGIDIGNWNDVNGGANGIYDPFRSSSVIDDLDGVQVSRDKSPLRRSQSANSRPTFADIAKKPSSPGSEPPPTPSLSNDEPVYGSQESLNSLLDRKVKQKAFRPAHPRHGGYSIPLPINPDSKYGLDDFEVQEAGCGKMERSFSCNDALDRSSQGGGHDLDHFTDDELASGDKQNGAPSSSAQASSEWFDPKRIFMNGMSRTRSESVPSETILNNNAAARVQQGAKNSGRRGTASYINNLHDSSHKATKQSNAERAKPAMNGNGTAKHSSQPDMNNDQPTTDEDMNSETVTTSAAGYYVSGSVRLGKVIVTEILTYLLLALMFVLGLASQTVYFVAHHTSVIVTTTFTYLAVKVGMNSGSPNDCNYNTFSKNPEKYGCDENIQLPETSEEAMRRLLTCRGKDPYSILGLCCEATDEDIRRYYRRQAVLVHPDKNKQPGAEEAFKILGQAFELIGTSEKRNVYDQKIESEKWSEEMRMQTEDLLQKLKEKYEEAAKWIHCSKCDQRHRRFLMERPVYSARKCNRCQCYHAAKEGEIWAETTFMGFKWHFYACMQNSIYDVTDWVVCQGLSNSIQPNAHSVHVKLSTPSTPNSPPSRPGFRDTADLENLESLIKNLFPPQHTPCSHGKPANPQTDGHAKSTPQSSRKGKRRTKRR